MTPSPFPVLANSPRECFLPFNPVIRFSVLVRNSNNKDVIFFNRIKQLVWKLVQKTFPDVATLYRPRLWIF